VRRQFRRGALPVNPWRRWRGLFSDAASPLRAATLALPDVDPASLLVNSARVAAWGWTVRLSSPRTGKPEAPMQSLNRNSGGPLEERPNHPKRLVL
jgi:hypothetical protein